jgi:DNA invertase Pin-like site-specific DNA recombinase
LCRSGGVAEFEREMIRDRTTETRARVANGIRLGRKPTLTQHRQQEAIKRRNTRKATPGEIGRSYDVSRWTISRLTWPYAMRILGARRGTLSGIP